MRSLRAEVLREFSEAAQVVPIRPLALLSRDALSNGFQLMPVATHAEHERDPRWQAWNERARAGQVPPRREVDMVAVAIRFWSKVDRSAGPRRCWPWIGATTKRRGKIVHGAFGMPVAGPRRPSGRASWTQCAHRVAFAFHHGIGWPLAPGVEVHRTCKTVLCCNPKHLREGAGKWKGRAG